MCVHSVFLFAVAAPDEKGGDWKLIFSSARFKLWNRSFTPKRLVVQAKTAKRALHWKFSSWFLMLSYVGAGQGWLQNIFLFVHVRIQFWDEFFVYLLLIRGVYLHHKSEKASFERRNLGKGKEMNFMQKCFFSFCKDSWRNVLDVMTKKRMSFPPFCTGNLFLRHLYHATCRWRSKKGNLKGNEDLELIKVKSTSSCNYIH